MADELETACRRQCLAFPEAEEKYSHGMSNFRIRGGKVFATYAANHHGDGRLALWLGVPDGVQQDLVGAEPRHFFVPPYVGPMGWLGVRLDQGIAWARIAPLIRLAYERIAPLRLVDALKKTPVTPAPKRRVTVTDIDPKNSPRGRKVLASMRKHCLALPESSEGLQFGQPVWRAGKKVFAQAYCYEGIWRVAFWVGVPAQGLMITDPRFSIPPYLGHNGWIALDVNRTHKEAELRALALESYRHFALKRMLAAL
jgi:predicted DNA-binding protein (MmcQ/YjbR family)